MRARSSRSIVTLATAAALAAACAAPDPGSATAGSPPRGAPWLSTEGTTTLGFGVLRLAPSAGNAEAKFRVRYRDAGDGGYSSDATSAILLVLPADAFAASDAAYADSWLAAARARGDGGSVEAAAEVRVDRDRVVLVAYGPWDGADTGRPPSNVHSFSLSVEPLDGGSYLWVESEAGEMVTTNWTRRPEVRRGGPAPDPVTGEPLWIETRVLVLYDPRVARAADEPGDTEEARERIVLTPALCATLREVSIRWR